MKIVNLSLHISTKTVKALINLLPVEYRNLSIPLYVCDNNYISRCVLSAIEVLDNDRTTHGQHCWIRVDGNIRTISLSAVFNPKNRLGFVDTLFHEFRHAYQVTHTSMYNNLDKLYNTPYRDRSIERDARRFSANMITKHKKAISKIMNIDVKHINFNHNTCECTKIAGKQHKIRKLIPVRYL